MVNIPVVIAPLDDDGSAPIPMITVADDVAITVPVTISVTLTNRYANTANTNPRPLRLQQALASLFQLLRRQLWHT